MIVAEEARIEITVSHRIVRLTRGSTRNSGSPMWRCETDDGQRVNIFKHADPVKNTFALFEAAGYAPALDAMIDGEERTWRQRPIFVTLAKDGQWWNVIAVLPAVDPEPDPPARPEHRPYRNRAIAQAYALTGLATAAIVYWDTETTGTGPDDEIIAFGAVNQFGETLFSTLIQPVNMDRVSVAGHVHGLTPDKLRDAPFFPEVFPAINRLLTQSLWVIYNAEFDVRLLEQDCLRHGLPLLVPVGVTCAMQLFAEYHGEWNFQHRHWQPKKLEFAAAQFMIGQPVAHDALADARTTHALLEKIAIQPVDYE